MRKTSLQGRFIFLLTIILVACVAVTVYLTLKWDSWTLVLPVVVLLTFLATIFVVKTFFAPINKTLQALRSGVDSFKDHDYSVSIATGRDDELGQLVEVYNNLAVILREERFGLFQRELMLDTVIQSSAVAVLITNPGGAIVYNNREAVDLMLRKENHYGNPNTALVGKKLNTVSALRSPVLAQALDDGKDGLFSLTEDDDATEVFHLTCRQFTLNTRIHDLFLLKKLTREIARKEVDTWKKLIRVITHEMNNSLAPINSLMSSAQKITQSGKGIEKLNEIYESIGNRTSHLQSFIEQYARFARLPQPRIQKNDWKAFVDSLHSLVNFQLAGELPEAAAEFDPVQMEQVLINLLKNASESGSANEDIHLRILQNDKELLMAVEDRGSGMLPEQMQLALLPFYSTKRSGTGLGLPLCREIIEAHGGTFNLFNREGGGLVVTCKLPLNTA